MYEYPKYYELVFGKRNIKKEVDFLESLFQKFSGRKIKTVLDIACGTGPHMDELEKRGYALAGLDNSFKMLRILQEMPHRNNFIGAYRQDMRNISIRRKFDACICMVNSLAILTENKDLISHFDSVVGVLEQGGLYIIEMDNPVNILSNPKPYEKAKTHRKLVKKGNISIEVIYEQRGFNLLKGTEQNRLTLNVNDAGKTIKIVDDSPIRRLLPTEIELLLRINKRLELVEIRGAFDYATSLHDKNSNRMIIILKKK
ncbi:MAG: class I SAM-dependent methyltransferase [Nanoarchaeota archaeon]|nr:class I SAM-dependent methyltransferase [Nanoarchaeota archaeon]